MLFLLAVAFVVVMMARSRDQWTPKGRGQDIGPFLAHLLKYAALALAGSLLLSGVFAFLRTLFRGGGPWFTLAGLYVARRLYLSRDRWWIGGRLSVPGLYEALGRPAAVAFGAAALLTILRRTLPHLRQEVPMWFVLAVVFVVVAMMFRRNQWNPRGTELDMTAFGRHLAKYFTIAIVGAFLLTFASDAVVVVPAGHRGVIFDRFKGVQTAQLNEGMNFIVPFLQEATIFDVRVQKVEFDATAASKDLQSVRTKVALNFNPIPEEVSGIYKQVGLDYTEKVIHPAVQEVVKAATARFTAEELIIKREDVKAQIHELLARHLTQAHLKLVETYITDFDFSTEFSKAIEAKQIAEQDALKAKRDLDRVKIEAEQKVAQARAEAEGLRLQKEAITPQLLELRRIEAQKLAIEKWDGRMPTVTMGNATPFINMGDIAKDNR